MKKDKVNEAERTDRGTHAAVRKYDTVIFDLDGTLLNTLEDLADAVNYVMGQFGYPKRTLEEVRCFVGNGIGRLIERAVPEGTSEDEMKKALARFKAYYTEHCQIKTGLYDGIAELVSELKSEGIRMAIVSNKNQEAVTELAKLYFPDSISVAVGQFGERRRKPFPDEVFVAMERLGSEKKRTLYVGDSEVDKETADNTGIDCVLVTWGFRDKEELKALKPYGMIDEPEELWEYLTNSFFTN